MTTYMVRAERAGRYWELHISERHGAHVGVTQVRHLWDAEMMVRDYLESRYERDSSEDRLLLYGKSIPIGQNEQVPGDRRKERRP